MKKSNFILSALIIILINSCTEPPPVSQIKNEEPFSARLYISKMEYDNINQEWDTSNKYIIESYDFHREFFPEGEYRTLYGKDYMKNVYPFILEGMYGKKMNCTKYSDGGSIYESIHYVYLYDNNGYLIEVSFYEYIIKSGKWIYIHNNGKLIEIEIYDTTDCLTGKYEYEYGNNGYISKELYLDSNNVLLSYTDYKYDNNDHLKELNDYRNDILSETKKYNYNNSGLIIEMIHETDSSSETTIYKYDNDNHLISEENIKKNIKINYQYDEFVNKYLKERIFYSNDSIPEYKWIYQYNWITTTLQK